MSNYRRLHVPGGTYFFHVCLAQPGSELLVQQIDTLRWAYAKTIASHPVTCHAMVVLPDQIYAVWTLPDDDDNFSERWRLIKARFSHGVVADLTRSDSKLRKRERGVWQRRFWEHLIRGSADYDHCIDTVLTSPVRAGLVSDPRDWPYSSLARLNKPACAA